MIKMDLKLHVWWNKLVVHKVSPSCIWRKYWITDWGHTLRSAHCQTHQPSMVVMPSPNNPSLQQCPAFPSLIIDLSQTSSLTYFYFKVCGSFHLAKAMFPTSRVVSFIMIYVFLLECFSCRLTPILFLPVLKIIDFTLHFFLLLILVKLFWLYRVSTAPSGASST